MDPETIAKLSELFDLKIDKLEVKLEVTIVEKVTAAVSENVSDVVTKRVDRKIDSMITPLAQRQEDFEVKTGHAISDLRKQLSDLSELVTKQPTNTPAQTSFPRDTSAFPPLPVVHARPIPQGHGGVSQTDRDHGDARAMPIKNIVNSAKCVIGLSPVTQEHVAQHHAQTDQVGLLNAVIDYLRKELNVKDTEISESDIDSVFLPPTANKDSFNKVYVRFKTEVPANLCLSLAKTLRNRDNRVTRYFPRPFNARLSALSNVAYKLRNENAAPYKTYIKYSCDDLVLMVCPPGQNSYQELTVQNLPPIDLTHLRSPPVGRKTKRQRSGTQSPPINDPKKDRRASPTKDSVDSLDSSNNSTINDNLAPGSGEEHQGPSDDHSDAAGSLPLNLDPPVLPLADIGRVSNLQAMSPLTGHLTFDFTKHPLRRQSLNF